MLSNALRMFANVFQRFQMRCDKKWLNAIFIKPDFPNRVTNGFSHFVPEEEVFRAFLTEN